MSHGQRKSSVVDFVFSSAPPQLPKFESASFPTGSKTADVTCESDWNLEDLPLQAPRGSKPPPLLTKKKGSKLKPHSARKRRSILPSPTFCSPEGSSLEKMRSDVSAALSSSEQPSSQVDHHHHDTFEGSHGRFAGRRISKSSTRISRDEEGEKRASRFSQSSISLNFFKDTDIPVKHLSLLNVKPVKSNCLSVDRSIRLSKSISSLEEMILLPVMETAYTTTPSLATPDEPTNEVQFSPKEWMDRLGTRQQEDFIFSFMRTHDLQFGDEFPHLNSAVEVLKFAHLPPADLRVDPSGLSFQGNKTTGAPFVKSGKVNCLLLMLVDAQARAACSFSSLEMSFFLTFPLFATHETLLSMFCASLQAASTDSKAVGHIVDAMHHWVGLIPEDFSHEDDEFQFGGGKDIEKKLNFLLSMTKNQPVCAVPIPVRNKRYLEELRKVETPPAPCLPINLHGGVESLSFMVLDPEEVARQMTLVAFTIYEHINPRAWLSPSETEFSLSGISQMCQDFNLTSSFISHQILVPKDENERADVLERTVILADKLLELRNFHHFMACVCAWNSAPISRLQKTWRLFFKNHKEVGQRYKELSSLGEMESNFHQLRDLLIQYPSQSTIPYLGLALSDITFIVDGNRNAPVPLDHVSFEVLSMIGECIIRIRVSQCLPYNFEPVRFIQDYLKTIDVVDHNQLYNLSLKLEPRVAHEPRFAQEPRGVHRIHSKKSIGKRMSSLLNTTDLEVKFKQMMAENSRKDHEGEGSEEPIKCKSMRDKRRSISISPVKPPAIPDQAVVSCPLPPPLCSLGPQSSHSPDSFSCSSSSSPLSSSPSLSSPSTPPLPTGANKSQRASFSSSSSFPEDPVPRRDNRKLSRTPPPPS